MAKQEFKHNGVDKIVQGMLELRPEFMNRKNSDTFIGIFTAIAQVFPEERSRLIEATKNLPFITAKPAKLVKRTGTNKKFKRLSRKKLSVTSGAFVDSNCKNCDKEIKDKYITMKDQAEEPEMLKEEPKNWVEPPEDKPKKITAKWESVEDVLAYFNSDVSAMKAWAKQNQVIIGNLRKPEKIAGKILAKFVGR